MKPLIILLTSVLLMTITVSNIHSTMFPEPDVSPYWYAVILFATFIATPWLWYDSIDRFIGSIEREQFKVKNREYEIIEATSRLYSKRIPYYQREYAIEHATLALANATATLNHLSDDEVLTLGTKQIEIRITRPE